MTSRVNKDGLNCFWVYMGRFQNYDNDKGENNNNENKSDNNNNNNNKDTSKMQYFAANA